MSFLEWAIGPGGNLDRRGSRETPHFPLLIFSYFVCCPWTMHFELDMQACQASSPHGGSAMEFTADRDTVDPPWTSQCAPVGSNYRVHCLQSASDSARLRDLPVQVQTARLLDCRERSVLLFLVWLQVCATNSIFAYTRTTRGSMSWQRVRR